MVAREWATAKRADAVPPQQWYCGSEGDWRGRWEKFVPYVRAEGITDPNIALVASAAGEVGDNCFAHNVGSWRDVPGCWFEWSVEPSQHILRLVIADRGRGVLASLAAVRPSLTTHRDALHVALTEQITGRTPEDRGRGLKVVLAILGKLRGGSFLLQTGDAVFSCTLPFDGANIAEHVRVDSTFVQGTYCTMEYHYAD